MRLWPASQPPPEDLAATLLDLGAGDTRFSGTSFGKGECSLDDFLKECRDRENHATVPPDLVPQSVYWLMDDNQKTVGIVRVRHWLNERLMHFGGHIGYYIRPAQRRKGYGSAALRLALDELRKRGQPRALLTVHPDNLASSRIVRAHGGIPDGQGAHPATGEVVDRYWIEL